ncbi:MAG: hemerythrin domain-containing protein, partial [Mycobacteriales bacterium]
MGDIFEELGQDHEQVKGLLRELDSSTLPTGEQARDQRRKLVDKLIIDESRHEAGEEQYFWPAVQEKLSDGSALAAKALAQEQEGKEVLDQLDGMSPEEAEFVTLVAKFVKAGREHIAYEEEQVWPRLRSVLT